MRQLCGILSERLRRGERAVLATVLKTAGSVPRTTGAAMAVFADGFSGTVGGGAVEFGALAVARSLLPGSSRSAPMTPRFLPVRRRLPAVASRRFSCDALRMAV